MEVFEFGSVTYCTNIARGDFPSDDEAVSVATQVAEVLELRLRESPFAEDVALVRIEYGVGCIMTTITFGATLAGLYKFVKDYPKFRPGLVLLLSDLNGIYVKLKNSKGTGSTYIARDDLPDCKELEDIAKESKAGTRKTAKVTKQVTKRAVKERGDNHG